jgi:hypothetical protein
MFILKPSKWRQHFKVHPAADAFPMMEGEELQKLGEDIKANGLRDPITVNAEGALLDGRNRLEAGESAGVPVCDQHQVRTFEGDDAAQVAFIISKNVHRRHLTQGQLADVLVALAKMEVEKETGPSGPVSDDAGKMPEIPPEFDRRGGRGKKNPVKEQAFRLNQALPKEQQVGERTIKRAVAKSDAKEAKPKAKVTKPKPQIRRYTPRPLPKPRSGKPVLGLEAARRAYLDLCTDPAVDIDAEIDLVTNTLREIAGKRGTKAMA